MLSTNTQGLGWGGSQLHLRAWLCINQRATAPCTTSFLVCMLSLTELPAPQHIGPHVYLFQLSHPSQKGEWANGCVVLRWCSAVCWVKPHHAQMFWNGKNITYGYLLICYCFYLYMTECWDSYYCQQLQFYLFLSTMQCFLCGSLTLQWSI